MATVKIHYDKSAKEMERYLKEKNGLPELTTEHSCFIEGLTEDFTRIQNIHNSNGNNSIHLIQSWHPDESKTLSPEKIHEMGIEIANRFAPGHQYVVQTHTDQPHYHNHILINPVSIETGKRIQNKLGHIETLRNHNDDIARERGLSVLPPQEKLRRSGLNEHVQRINQFRGRSYIVDMVNKIGFARHHATNYDEFVSLLNAFDIKARIEPQNITYFYPGREHGKRGKNLGEILDKKGLETKFQSNLEKYQTEPELKKTLSELVAQCKRVPVILKAGAQPAKKAEPLVSTRAEGITQPRSEELIKSLIPLEEIQKAQTADILRYCERAKIPLEKNEKGEMVLTGRPYVEVSANGWTNHKNKTKGNAIDFVAYHRQTSYLNAVATLNNNPRLLLLEQQMGELRKPYQSFHFPKDDPASRPDAIRHLSKLLNHSIHHDVHGELFKRQSTHVSNSGAISFYPEKNSTGYTEYVRKVGGGYETRKYGEIISPFFDQKGSSSELQLFVDAKTFLSKAPQLFAGRSKNISALALLEPNVSLAQKVITRPHIKSIRLICEREDAACENILQFTQELKKSLALFSIDISVAHEPSLVDRSRGLELGMGF